MQDLAHLKVNGETILVLRRAVRYGVDLKFRKSGKEGRLLDEESLFFEGNPQAVTDLKNGKTFRL